MLLVQHDKCFAQVVQYNTVSFQIFKLKSSFSDGFIEKYKKKLQNNLASEKFEANTSSYFK